MRSLTVFTVYEVYDSGMWKIQALENMPYGCAGTGKQKHRQDAEEKLHD
jgi:hypothetical protein